MCLAMEDRKQISYYPENISLNIRRVSFSRVRTAHEACWLFQNACVGEESPSHQKAEIPALLSCGSLRAQGPNMLIIEIGRARPTRGEAQPRLPGTRVGQHRPAHPILLVCRPRTLPVTSSPRSLPLTSGCLYQGNLSLGFREPRTQIMVPCNPHCFCGEKFLISHYLVEMSSVRELRSASCTQCPGQNDKFWTCFHPSAGPIPAWST